MSESIRAWSLTNSLFSNRTGDTADTAASTASSSSQSKPLQVVEELQQNDVYEEPPQPQHLERTTGAIATAQNVPVMRSLPVRAPTSAPAAHATAASAAAAPAPVQPVSPVAPPAPSTASMASTASKASSLFGAPNIQIPIATSPTPSHKQTEAALAQLHLGLGRMLDSVAAGRTSILVTRSASAAQIIEDYCKQVGPDDLSNANENRDLVGIIRIALAFTDCLVRGPNLRSTRMSLLRSLEMLGVALGLVEPDPNTPVTCPRNFALERDTMHSGLCNTILHELSSNITEQEGAYVAPVRRGLSSKFSVASLCIGIPHLTEAHWAQVTQLMSACPELHIYARKDGVLPAQRMRVVPPFRVPDPLKPPIGISVAPEAATHTSGTLGGYIYPMIDENDASLESFRNATFALTCGHVCLPDADAARNIDKPVMTPSPVLAAMFRKALDTESQLHSNHSFEYHAYREAIQELDLNPPKSLGHLVWGERAVVGSKVGSLMSDMAIIKCDPEIQCRNYLGDDIDLGGDLGLMFERTVTHVVPPELASGLQVFKYGATTKHTSGTVSSSRIVYWSNNKLQSTEFVVRAETPVFASGGDSGAWVLARGKYTGSSGLGVVGMVHSYDGEFKEFGLFTPIGTVLDRLTEVTNVPWAVVGVPTQNDGNVQVSSD